MPTKDTNFSNAKFSINGKEIPCEIVEIKTTHNSTDNDIDDFGLHFDYNREASFTCDSCEFSAIALWKLIGAWDNLKWYQKLWLIICSKFTK